MKRGLVMEGGAMRGLFTAGVIDVFMESGVEFDGAIGVSAGACFGCNYKTKQPGRAFRYNIRFCRDPRYSGVRTLLRTGDLYSAECCYHTIPEELDPFDYEMFVKNPMEFWVVCTDVETGEPVYHQMLHAGAGEMEYLQASASMPLVSRPVRAGERRLLDGGMSDSIPLKYFESIGYDRNVAILTRPADYVKEPNSMMPLIRLALRKYPKLADAMACRHEVYNQQTAYARERAKAGAAIVIQPKEPLPVKRVEHDAAKLRACYELGRAAGRERLDEVREFLGAGA